MKNFDIAIKYYDKCLKINSKNPSTYTALGLTYQLKGNLN